jgi:hypothetical protein
VEDATEQLAAILALVRIGRREPIYFWPDVSLKAFEKYQATQDLGDASQAAEWALKDRYDKVRVVDDWVLGAMNPFDAGVDEGHARRAARTIWAPLLAHSSEVAP